MYMYTFSFSETWVYTTEHLERPQAHVHVYGHVHSNDMLGYFCDTCVMISTLHTMNSHMYCGQHTCTCTVPRLEQYATCTLLDPELVLHVHVQLYVQISLCSGLSWHCGQCPD